MSGTQNDLYPHSCRNQLQNTCQSCPYNASREEREKWHEHETNECTWLTTGDPTKIKTLIQWMPSHCIHLLSEDPFQVHSPIVCSSSPLHDRLAYQCFTAVFTPRLVKSLVVVPSTYHRPSCLHQRCNERPRYCSFITYQTRASNCSMEKDPCKTGQCGSICSNMDYHQSLVKLDQWLADEHQSFLQQCRWVQCTLSHRGLLLHIIGRMMYCFIMVIWPLLRFPLSKAVIWIAIPNIIISCLFMINTQINHSTEECSHGSSTNILKHKVLTAQNFGCNSVFCFFFSGGLNFQIEHHLFQFVNHCHLPWLAPKVKILCKKHGVDYNEAMG